MARPTSRKKSPLSQAVTDLRTRMGQSQQEFANALGVALNTIARYETRQPPRGDMLARLTDIAKEHGFHDLVDQFQSAAPLYRMFQLAAQQIETFSADQVALALAALLTAEPRELAKVRSVLKAKLPEVNALASAFTEDQELRTKYADALKRGDKPEAERIAGKITQRVGKYNAGKLSKAWRARPQRTDGTEVKW
jgi:transcriptional regulator with XRE-family HTH domain